MFKITALAVMLLGLVIGSGAADTPQLRGARALDTLDSARAQPDDDNETTFPPAPEGKGRGNRDPCFFAKNFGNLDLGCYELIPRRNECRIRPYKQDQQKCSQEGYGFEKCSKNVCSRGRGRYNRKCGTKVPAYDGLVCYAPPAYTVGKKLDKCGDAPKVCNKRGECVPCK